MRCQVIAGLILLGSVPARAEDHVATLVFDGPAGTTEHHEIDIESVVIPIASAQYLKSRPDGAMADPEQGHVVALTAEMGPPQAALLAWASGNDRRRHAVLRVQDRIKPAAFSTFEMDAEASGVVFAYGRPGPGQLTISLVLQHLTINGQAVY